MQCSRDIRHYDPYMSRSQLKVTCCSGPVIHSLAPVSELPLDVPCSLRKLLLPWRFPPVN